MEVREADRVDSEPLLINLIDALQTHMMTKGPGASIHRDYSGHVVHLLEALSTLAYGLEDAEDYIQKTADKESVLAAHLQDLVDLWNRREDQYKQEIARLEKLMVKDDPDGIKNILLNRSKSVVQRGGRRDGDAQMLRDKADALLDLAADLTVNSTQSLNELNSGYKPILTGRTRPQAEALKARALLGVYNSAKGGMAPATAAAILGPSSKRAAKAAEHGARARGHARTSTSTSTPADAADTTSSRDASMRYVAPQTMANPLDAASDAESDSGGGPPITVQTNRARIARDGCPHRLQAEKDVDISYRVGHKLALPVAQKKEPKRLSNRPPPLNLQKTRSRHLVKQELGPTTGNKAAGNYDTDDDSAPLLPSAAPMGEARLDNPQADGAGDHKHQHQRGFSFAVGDERSFSTGRDGRDGQIPRRDGKTSSPSDSAWEIEDGP